ncbi:MAG: hypothetical protein IIC78_07485 [Chloroflexi bacterium]|nr:hypothetical protein [Chloroflexota bacterium]
MRRKSKLLISAGILTIVAAACNSQPSTEETEVVQIEPQSTQEASTEVAQIEPQSTQEEESAERAQLSLTWEIVEIGEGIKPAFALDANGVVHSAFMTEADHGHVYYAHNASGAFEIIQVSEGYFYGPLDIALDANGSPFIAYHDHQETDFIPRLGDEVVAFLQDGVWELVTVSDDGHDGWDNSIVIDRNGNWHTAAVDPSQFGSQDGVEYATNAGGEIAVTAVSSGPVEYEFGTSIQLKSDGSPGITYYNNRLDQLEYAWLDGSTWVVEVVDEDGDVGRYSSLAFDAQDNPHITYYVRDTNSSGVVRYAWWDGSAWQMEDIDSLDDVRTGQTGARKITSLAIDGEGGIHVAYTDQSRLVYARRGDSGWATQEVEIPGDQTLGQLVELEMDAEGNPHLISFLVTSVSPELSGIVIYASGS